MRSGNIRVWQKERTLQYSQDVEGPNKNRSYGLRLWDRPDEYPISKVNRIVDSVKSIKGDKRVEEVIGKMVDEGSLGAERLFVGKTKKGDVGLFIRDGKGVVRIKTSNTLVHSSPLSGASASSK
ncbi:hypothetical protein [Chitinophaga flava]|uniref:hypothetical protein n=1 Tax=Chitinophaga flava TaxID=2259036 RepID=UPI001379C0B9|nr:hypothetical protein [Chitinophaga flava]